MFLAKKILAALLLPPTGLVLLACAGLLLSRFRRRQGVWLVAISLAALLLLSLPLTARLLNSSLGGPPPISAAQLARSQAIVVLGGGVRLGALEFSGDTVSAATLERLRYAARLARQSGLPLLVTGGAVWGGRSEGEAMKQVLEEDYGLKVRWVETASRDTAENARLSAPLLKVAGVGRIALVSHESHLPRAVPLFVREGFVVAPAPTGFSAAPPERIEEFLPNAGALRHSTQSFHEWLGRFANLFANK